MSHDCSSLCSMTQLPSIAGCYFHKYYTLIAITGYYFRLNAEYHLLYREAIMKTCEGFFMFTDDSLCDKYVRVDAIIKKNTFSGHFP